VYKYTKWAYNRDKYTHGIVEVFMNPIIALVVLLCGISYIVFEDEILFEIAILDHQQMFMLLGLAMIAAAIGFMFNE